jgi:hypothetical protein
VAEMDSPLFDVIRKSLNQLTDHGSQKCLECLEHRRVGMEAVDEVEREFNRLTATQGLPADLAALLRDPTITVPRDHEVCLADGRTLFEHLQEWQNAPSNTASAHISVQLPKPWWFMHGETCPRYGKTTVDATLCTCDDATRAAITAAAKEYRVGDPYP